MDIFNDTQNPRSGVVSQVPANVVLPDLLLPPLDVEFEPDEGSPLLPDDAYYSPVSESLSSERVANLLHGLNKQQKEAVTHEGPPLLIMAGAGSGKTRVLTHRIAYLLATGRATAGEILAITFTNKAAAEMRERLRALVDDNTAYLWVSTFHSACMRILRKEYKAAGISSSFTIYDSQDSQRLIQMILKDRGIDIKRYTPKMVAARISDLKNELVTPDEYEKSAPNDPPSRVIAQVYPVYMARLVQANALDFDDLIMRTVRLFQTNPGVAEHYHRRFRHVLVDEYQDTNHAQYTLVRELIGYGKDRLEPAHLTVVGDSDQSIYAFRGATIRNIEEFERDFPGAKTILLEQNYRSTQNILTAANAVISQNLDRRPKNLWTSSGAGEPVVLDVAESEHDEARFVISEIDRLSDSGESYGDVAIFYRTNAQSRAFEEKLMQSGIPYRVVGGTKFYERKEIKDALAYLQLVSNPDDSVAIRRIINVPRRGIGEKAEQALFAYADSHRISYGQAVHRVWLQEGMPQGEGAGIELPDDGENTGVVGENRTDEIFAPLPDAGAEGKDGNEVYAPVTGITARARAAIASFEGLMTLLRHLAAKGASPAQILEEALDHTGYLTELQRSTDPQDASRVENLAELHSAAGEFAQNNQGATLADYLERVALVADSDQVPAEKERGAMVTLMTVHTAKGLEFPTVFVTGMEDGTFPHQRALGETSELAEERRLAYVAITRARSRLYLTRAAVRSTWGKPQVFPPSRFLDAIPPEVVSVRRSKTFSDQIRGSSMWRMPSATTSTRGADVPDSGPIFGSGGLPRGERGTVFAHRAISRMGAPRFAPKNKGESPIATYRVGDQVSHATLGKGSVIAVEGQGERQIIKVEFVGATKRLLARMAPIEKI